MDDSASTGEGRRTQDREEEMKPTKESMDMVVDLISMVYSEIARDNVMLREQVKALQGRITFIGWLKYKFGGCNDSTS